MNCPKCDLPILSDQRFCRSCGASLRMTTQPLPEPVLLSEGENTSAQRPGKTTYRANNWMLLGFIVIFLGAAIGIIGKKLMHDEVVAVIGALMSLAGMFLMVYPHLVPQRRRPEPTAPSQPEQFQTQPAKSLAGESTTEYVPSITERTTDLLKNPTARSKSDEDGTISR